MRDRAATADGAYQGAVADWRDERVERYVTLLREHVADDGTAAVLVWGVPALYDGTIAVVEGLVARGNVPVVWEVIAGVSSVAAHRIPLNRAGRSVLITPAGRVAEGLPDGVDDAVVMLDGRDTHCLLAELAPS